MRSFHLIAGMLAAAALSSCGGAARDVSLADARAAVTRIAGGTPAEALCKPEGREALRQAVRDYTAALAREGRPFEAVRRGGPSAESVAIYGLVVGDVKVNDFQGESRVTAKRVLAVANEFERTQALRTMHRAACAQTVAYLRDEGREQAASHASERRIERALENGDFRRAAQLQQRANRRERIAERSAGAFEREIEWLLGS